jgi:hypothetical protein
MLPGGDRIRLAGISAGGIPHAVLMPLWLRHMFAWTALLAFAVGAKLHLPFVQTAGWARMTANYAALMPVRDALETALSGRELCGVCSYVRDAQNAKQTTDALVGKSLGAAESPALAPVLVGILIEAPEIKTDARPIPEDLFAEARFGRPETPPPRAA